MEAIPRIIKPNIDDSSTNSASDILKESISEIELCLIKKDGNEGRNLNAGEEEPCICIKTLDNKIMKVNFSDFKDKNIKALKMHLFPTQMSNNQNVRFIYQAKLLGDDEKIGEISYEKGFFIHAAISDGQMTSSNAQNINNNPIDNSGANSIIININSDVRVESVVRRGFDEFLAQYSDKEIERLREIWHTGYKLDNYSGYRMQMYLKEDQLILMKRREIEENLKQIKADFEREEEGTNLDFILSLFLGYTFNFFSMLISILLPFNKKIKFGATLGFFIYILIFLIVKNPQNENQSLK